MIKSGKGRTGVVLGVLIALVAISAPATAVAKDRNRDRIPDRWEKSYDLSLKRDQRKLDQDSDGLRNRGEWLAGTSPRDRDTDDDGVTDLKEKAGVISAWDPEAMTLEVTLYAGGTVSGSVDEMTRVVCPPAADPNQPVDEGEGTDPQPLHFGGRGHFRPPHGAEDEADLPPDEMGAPHGRPGRPDGCGANCSLEDLAVGVEIEQADVRYTADGIVFTRLKIDAPVTDPNTDPVTDPVG